MNVDGIRKSSSGALKQKRTVYTFRTARYEIIPKVDSHVYITPLVAPEPSQNSRFSFKDIKNTVPVKLALMLLMLASFFAGGIVVLNSRTTDAENIANTPEQVLGTSTQQPPFIGPQIPQPTIDLQVVANTSVNLLNDYLEGPATEQQLLVRKEKLKNYLELKKSPFANDDGTLDALVHVSHMKIILEVAFAESTLGKKCVDNNCSNIGSAPSRPYWHQYKTLANWVLDFNRLLDRRYKDWTLKEMCGVYVQPCTDTWLAATGQVSQELAQWGID